MSALIFGGLGLTFLILAACGVGPKHVYRLPGVPRTPEPQAAGAGAAAAPRRSGPFSDRPLPFFHVRYNAPGRGRGHRIYRVYLADDDVLFLSLHVATVNRNRQPSPGAALASGGLVGGLVAGLVAGVNAFCQMTGEAAYEARTRFLDGVTDEARLRQFAEADPESFTLPIQGVRDLRVESPSFWDKLNWPGEIAGKLRLNHPAHGAMSLGLPWFEDVCKAIEVLPQRFGNEVQITTSWNAF